MNLKQAKAFLEETSKRGFVLGLDNMERILALFDNPHEKLKYVHVAGTNGKGSTATYLAAVLMEAGYRVGLYTSPSIHRLSERIQINFEEISDADFLRLLSLIKDKSEENNIPITEFEVLTALAFQYYAEKTCDIVILEVGMGGRLDATNIIGGKEAAVITNIGLDHTEYLGDTIEAIAAEKAGIIKTGCPVILYDQSQEVLDVIRKRCKELSAPLRICDFNKISNVISSEKGQMFDYMRFKKIAITMMGVHQINNAVLALETLEILKKRGWMIPMKAIRTGMKEAIIKGRLEKIYDQPIILVDGSHNAQGVKTMMDSLRLLYPGQNYYFIIGFLRDKDYDKAIATIAPWAKGFYTITPHSARALTSIQLAEFISMFHEDVIACDTTEHAIKRAMQAAEPDDVIVILGSLYQVGEVREYFHLK